MTDSWTSLLAMAPPAADGAQGGNPLGIFPMMAIMALIVYFMMIRPQQRREKERREMLKNVKSGDRVLFGGGLIGTVTNTKEHTLVIKIAENVKVEAARSAVSRVLDKDDKGVEAEQA